MRALLYRTDGFKSDDGHVLTRRVLCLGNRIFWGGTELRISFLFLFLFFLVGKDPAVMHSGFSSKTISFFVALSDAGFVFFLAIYKEGRFHNLFEQFKPFCFGQYVNLASRFLKGINLPLVFLHTVGFSARLPCPMQHFTRLLWLAIEIESINSFPVNFHSLQSLPCFQWIWLIG